MYNKCSSMNSLYGFGNINRKRFAVIKIVTKYVKNVVFFAR